MDYVAYWDITTLIIYIFVGLVPVFAFVGIKKKRDIYRHNICNRYYFVWYISWLIFAVGRHIEDGIGGSDAITYITYFDVCLDKNSSHIYALHNDFLYVVLNRIIRLITADYHVLFLVVYSIIILSYILILDEFYDPKRSIIPLTILVYIYIRGFTSIRSNLAVALILFSVYFLKKDRYIISLVFAVSSIFMHKASLIYATFFIVGIMYKKKKLNLKTMILFVGLSIIAFRLARQFILTHDIAFLDSGAYVYYLHESMTTNFFKSYWKIAFSQLLLAGVLLIMNTPINKYFESMTFSERSNAEFIRLICYFDIILIPGTYITGIWRGYEYLYIFRLVMWGYIIDIVCSKFTLRSRKLIKILFLIVFVSWMTFRLYNTYEDSCLMPYIFELFAK